MRTFLASLLVLGLLSACGGPPPGAATAGPTATAEAPARAGMCVACHGIDGRSTQPGTPHLAGQDALYLRESLRRYRSGERRHAAMQAIAGGLDEADIEALARYYAQLPAAGGSAAGAP